MTTEFHRVQASVVAVEQMVMDLVNSPGFEGHAFCPCPRPRAEVAFDEDDWIVVGSRSAVEASAEQRAEFLEVERRFTELEPMIERLSRRCKARDDFESTKDMLLRSLEAAGGRCSSQSSEYSTRQLFADSQAFVETRGKGHDDIRSLLEKTVELEASATYGTKMVEQVLDLLARHDAIRALFNTDVVPRLGSLVAAAAANEEMWQVARERRLVAEAEEEARRCQADELRPVLALLAASEQRQQEECEAKELLEWQCAQTLEERLRPCQFELGSALPSVMWMYS
jgi:hypothetical protein